MKGRGNALLFFARLQVDKEVSLTPMGSILMSRGGEERGTHCISYYHLLILWYLASGAEFYLLYFEALLSQFHNVMYSAMRALERHILLEYRVQHGHDVPLCYFLCIANKVSLFSPFFVFFVLSIVFLLYHVSRGTLMHGLQGAEAQGPTLERGPTGCREIIFFE